jgi:hypothetical protein
MAWLVVVSKLCIKTSNIDSKIVKIIEIRFFMCKNYWP